MPDPVTNWIDGRIKTAVDEALAELRGEIQADLQAMETGLTAQITSLPGQFAGEVGQVVVDTEGIAAGVFGKLQTFLPSLFNPQQIIDGVLQGIPNVLNPFKGGR